MTTTLLILLAAAALGGFAWYSFWKPHAVRFAESGYRPPKTSIFGKFWFNMASRFLVFMTVGPVKVYGSHNLPRNKKGHVFFCSNHQLPPDFAMLRRGAGRHFRMLTSSDELKGFFGVISAFLGVISVSTKEKGGGALAEQACVDTAAEADGAIGIFPQGALLPDNVLKKEEFRPGLVRMGRAAAAKCGEPVLFVPMAVFYRHDPAHADWTHRFLKKTRSMFLGMRNPKHWDPIFKLDLDALGAAERADVERLREEKLKAYRRSRVTNYGGVVVIGEPIDPQTLPADPLEAIEVIRLKIADLLNIAEQR